ncbi:MAG TPA: helix-turn-helix domain-containing protein [Anaerolineae bacterium]
MSKQLPQTFFPWLDNQLDKLGLNDNQLAKKAGIAHSVISKARSREKGIGWDALLLISQAMNIPPEEAFKEAGLLPKAPNYDSGVDELIHLYQQAPPDEKERMLHLAREMVKIANEQRTRKSKKS